MRLSEPIAIIVIICLLLASALIVLDILAFVELKKKRKGQWELKEPKEIERVTLYRFFKCSECGQVSETKTAYCCHCGADMRGEE